MGHKPIGSMYMYEATEVITIDTVSVYQGVTGFSVGSVIEGLTFLASATGAITDTENNSSVLRCTDVGHGLTTGQYVNLHGMGDAAHDGTTRVTVISVDVFDCDNITYNSIDDTGNWSRGSSLIVNTGRGGPFVASFSASILSAGNVKNYRFELVVNATALDEFAGEQMVSALNQLTVIGTAGAVQLSAGDVVWMQCKCTTDATDVTIEHANMMLVRH